MSDWVAFDSGGYPYAFADAEYMSGKEFREECPEAAEVRLVDVEERSRLLDIHMRGRG